MEKEMQVNGRSPGEYFTASLVLLYPEDRPTRIGEHLATTPRPKFLPPRQAMSMSTVFSPITSVFICCYLCHVNVPSPAKSVLVCYYKSSHRRTYTDSTSLSTPPSRNNA